LTKYLHGHIDDKQLVSNPKLGTKIWNIAFEVNWQGDLSTLPQAYLPNIRDGLLSVHTRSMYDRLCQLFPSKLNLPDPETIDFYFFGDSLVSVLDWPSELVHIPIRRLWFDLIPQDIEPKIEDYAHYLAVGGHFEFLRHVVEKGLFNPSSSEYKKTVYTRISIMTCAANSGRLDLVEYLNQQGCEPSISTAISAAKSGNLHVLQHVHSSTSSKGFPIGVNEAIFNAAAISGDVEIVKYCRSNSFSCSYNALHYAAKHGHLELVKYLVETYPHDQWQGCIHNLNPLVAAGEYGHVQVADYLYSNFTKKYADSAVRSAAIYGQLEFVKHFVENYPMETKALTISGVLNNRRATEEKLLQVVEYLHDVEVSSKGMLGKLNDLPVSDLNFELECAILAGHFRIVKFLIKVRQCPRNEGFIALAKEMGQFEIAEYLAVSWL
jgi:hypothetical protein